MQIASFSLPFADDSALRSARYVANEVPGARLYESRQGWNHDFMFVEMDKLLRLLLGVGPQHGPNHSDFGKM